MTIDETVRQIESIAAGLETYTPTADDVDDLRDEIASLTDERDLLLLEIEQHQAALEQIEDRTSNAIAKLDHLRGVVEDLANALDY